jgi:proteic killer suppression protein
VRSILARLDVAETLEDLALPSYRLHELRGELQGFWAVRVNANWRIIFRLENGDIHDVELLDYH